MTELKEGIAGEVRIGAITSIATLLLPSLVRAILDNFKNLRVTISAQNVSQLCESVRTGELDLAIILSDQEPSGLSASVLRTELFYFVVAPGHSAAGTAQLGVEHAKEFSADHGPGEQYLHANVDQTAAKERCVAI